MPILITLEPALFVQPAKAKQAASITTAMTKLMVLFIVVSSRLKYLFLQNSGPVLERSRRSASLVFAVKSDSRNAGAYNQANQYANNKYGQNKKYAQLNVERTDESDHSSTASGRTECVRKCGIPARLLCPHGALLSCKKLQKIIAVTLPPFAAAVNRKSYILYHFFKKSLSKRQCGHGIGTCPCSPSAENAYFSIWCAGSSKYT